MNDKPKDRLAERAEEMRQAALRKPPEPLTFDGRFTWGEFYRDAAFNHPVSG